MVVPFSPDSLFLAQHALRVEVADAAALAAGCRVDEVAISIPCHGVDSLSSLRSRLSKRAIWLWVARISCTRDVTDDSTRETIAVSTTMSSRTLATSLPN